MRQNAKNDGSAFESMVMMANDQYERRGFAFVTKTPNPWVVRRMGGRIVTAVPTRSGRMVDFVGVMRGGTALAFDAKSTMVETRFDLKNIGPDQVRFLHEYDQRGGIAFLLVEFKQLREVYLVPVEALVEYWDEYIGHGRKSIPYEDFQNRFEQVKQGRGVILDYLAALARYKVQALEQ